MKVHQMKALSQLGRLRTQLQQSGYQTVSRPVAEDSSSQFRKVPSQLIFDLELEDSGESRQSSRPASAAMSKVQQAMLPHDKIQAELLKEAEQAWMKIASQTQGTGTSALAEALRQRGYNASQRMALGGGNTGGSACLQNLCHRFVSCSVQEEGCTASYVVDPHFREQFEIARPTASYRGLLASLPEVVVLTEDQVIDLVQLLCKELGECFKQVGEAIPPWRRPASMVSKWKPRHSMDGGSSGWIASSSMQPEAGIAPLRRESALPATSELSRQLPSSRLRDDSIASEQPAPRQQQGLQALQSGFYSQLERFESLGPNANLMSDMRRLLAFY